MTLQKVPDTGHHLTANFHGEGRHVDADQTAVALRIETQIGGLNGLLNLFNGRGIEGADDDLVGFRNAYRPQLLDWDAGTVDLDLQRIDHARVRTAGAYAGTPSGAR